MRRRSLVLLASACVVFGCGGDDGGGSNGQGEGVSFDAAIRDAQAVGRADLPAVQGRTLEQIANTLAPIEMGLATSTYTPGRNRLAFGMIDDARAFVYGKTALYVGRSPRRTAIGPFPAPADPLVVEPPYRSQGAALETGGLAAIYEAQVELPEPGRWYVLAITRTQGRLYGAVSQVDVRPRDAIPNVGAPAPRVDTDTVTSAGGDIEAIDTRVPPDDMHDVSFREVVGEKPVALLFATPALCESRVCGPVVDIAAQLKTEYGERVEFIHQEVYVDNDPQQGLRPPLQAFDLTTEPWLFTVDEDGRVAARLEGSFGTVAFERAIEAALQGGGRS